MMDVETNFAYGLFWVIYLIAFVVFFYAILRPFRIIPVYGIRTLLQAALVVVLLTPVESSEAPGWWMPAWLHAGYETILGQPDEAGRAILNLGIAAIIMLLVWILDMVRYRLVKR